MTAGKTTDLVSAQGDNQGVLLIKPVLAFGCSGSRNTGLWLTLWSCWSVYKLPNLRRLFLSLGPGDWLSHTGASSTWKGWSVHKKKKWEASLKTVIVEPAQVSEQGTGHQSSLLEKIQPSTVGKLYWRGTSDKFQLRPRIGPWRDHCPSLVKAWTRWGLCQEYRMGEVSFWFDCWQRTHIAF